MILEADVFCVTEGSIRTTISPKLQSWNIAESVRTWQGDVSPAGSKTVACYQTEIMGTREAQYALFALLIGAGVCAIKPMNGKISQMAYWESDQFIVLMKQGNACGGKGLTVEPLRPGHIFRTQIRVKDGNKTVLITYLEKDGEVLLKSRMREIFMSGSVRGLVVTSGLLPQKEVRYGLYSTKKLIPPTEEQKSILKLFDCGYLTEGSYLRSIGIGRV